jgi:OFA family oxalate/formate antiporter-like MFS transporter
LRRQFYLLWLQLFVNVISGITIISNAVFILGDLTKLSASAIAPLFGLINIFNAVGRFFWGAVSDRIGCNHTFAAMFAVQSVTLFLVSGSFSGLLPINALVLLTSVILPFITNRSPAMSSVTAAGWLEQRKPITARG